MGRNDETLFGVDCHFHETTAFARHPNPESIALIFQRFSFRLSLFLLSNGFFFRSFFDGVGKKIGTGFNGLFFGSGLFFGFLLFFFHNFLSSVR
ncbi:MAG TPA: hypothetical protein DHV41_00510 [Parachlamydiales bacterium]|nr:hypothetical protein [Parachlamydiales bacterium]